MTPDIDQHALHAFERAIVRNTKPSGRYRLWTPFEEQIPRVIFDIHYDRLDDQWIISGLVARPRGQGHGTRCMKFLCDTADEFRQRLAVFPNPIPMVLLEEAHGPNLSTAQLERWYRAQGFEPRPRSVFFIREALDKSCTIR